MSEYTQQDYAWQANMYFDYINNSLTAEESFHWGSYFDACLADYEIADEDPVPGCHCDESMPLVCHYCS